jgi:glutamyl-tRNA synthetase
MNIRVRFAPSPTGYLHIGGARTALFNWLLARHRGGTFILRIEDTDLERSTPEATEQILESLKWLGLTWDEGPYFQTQRFDLYRAALERLLESKSAYRCRCTIEELEAKRAEAERQKRPYRYDRACRDKDWPADGTPFTIRFKSLAEGELVFEDAVIGPVRKAADDLDDLILARSDGSPTYNFCVVVDDVDMGITHVVRALEHLNNTPRQLQIYKALGARPPVFAHVPVINGPDNKKLSKRREAEYRAMGFAVSVLEYRDMGYLPDALVNYLARLGWAHGDQEVFTLQELIDAFGLDGVGKSPAVFDVKKLRWLNQHYLMRRSAGALVEALGPHLARRGLEQAWLGAPPGLAERLVRAYQERSTTLEDLAESVAIYLLDAVEIEPQAADKHLTAEAVRPLDAARELLATIEPFAAATLEPACKQLVERLGLKLGQLAQPLRVALTGRTASPGIFEVIEMLGRERALARIDSARSRIAGSA